ncbi:hypothetical protein ANN_25188 [Periplaneta americana]|uniref:Uncharacterized protein n=1 Tax=Periplaneta americana TaxID=6978 RepID=A0ABQ8S0X6_PERAM|nr:hypothetical protein ANN_25188 [Periplaneta americana]
MAGLCEGGNEPPGSLKPIIGNANDIVATMMESSRCLGSQSRVPQKGGRATGGAEGKDASRRALCREAKRTQSCRCCAGEVKGGTKPPEQNRPETEAASNSEVEQRVVGGGANPPSLQRVRAASAIVLIALHSQASLYFFRPTSWGLEKVEDETKATGGEFCTIRPLDADWRDKKPL